MDLLHSCSAGTVLQQRHQDHRVTQLNSLVKPSGRFVLKNSTTFVFITTQLGHQRSFESLRPGLLLDWVVDHRVALQALLHGEGLPAGWLVAAERPQLLVEGPDVALQVEVLGEGPAAALPRTQQAHAGLGVHALVLLQEPRVSEDFVATVAAHLEPVSLLPVLQVLRPGLGDEVAVRLIARVASVHLLVALQAAGEGEAPGAAWLRALVGWQGVVLLAHVRSQLLVFAKFQPTAFHLARVATPLVRAVHAALVPDAVGVGGERLAAAVHGAPEGPVATVTELVPRQVIGGGKRPAAVRALARERPRAAGVRGQVRVQLPLFDESRRTARKCAEVAFVCFWFGFHLSKDRVGFREGFTTTCCRRDHVTSRRRRLHMLLLFLLPGS